MWLVGKLKRGPQIESWLGPQKAWGRLSVKQLKMFASIMDMRRLVLIFLLACFKNPPLQ